MWRQEHIVSLSVGNRGETSADGKYSSWSQCVNTFYGGGGETDGGAEWGVLGIADG